jgi:RHS repeat-associated protein
MAGISSNALKGVNYPQNTKKYNGIEFTEDLDLDIYDAQFRNLDPQIGRWNQVDPKIEHMEMWSPYASNYDNPARYNDFLGDEPNGSNDPVVKVGMVTGRTYNLTKPTDVGSTIKFGVQYTLGILNEGLALVNQNINPVYGVVNGVTVQFTGKDILTGQPVNRAEGATQAIMSLLPGGTLERGIANTAEKVTAKQAAKAVEKYEVGTFDNLTSRSVVGDGLDIHHAPQKQPAGHIIPGYDKATAPSIALPRAEHVAIPNMKGTQTAGNARQQLALDILNLRKYTNAPNSSLQQLIDLNKKMYPSTFKK